MSVTLLTKAKYDVGCAQLSLAQPDDGYVQIAASHTQQALEKLIKYVLENYGVDYRRIRHIDKLLEALPSSQTVFDSDDFAQFSDFKDSLYRWESEVRYVTDYLASRDRVVRVCQFAEELYVKISSFDFGTDSPGVLEKPTISKMNLD